MREQQFRLGTTFLKHIRPAGACAAKVGDVA